MAPLFVSLTYIVSVAGKIRIALQRVWRILFLVFPTLFLCITFLSFGFTVISISWKIRFAWWWVWQLWVWLWVIWYVQFSFLLWIIRWLCWKFLCLCLWRGFWSFSLDRNRVNWWHFSVRSVCTNRIQVQRWSTHWNILAPKFLIFPPILKISFIAIF